MAVEFAGTGFPDGLSLGRTTDKVALYGETPVTQPAPVVAVGTDLATVILELADLRAALVSLGAIAS